MSAPLTLADKSTIRHALNFRAEQLEKLLVDLEGMRVTFTGGQYDRLRTQLKTELEQVNAAIAKVRP